MLLKLQTISVLIHPDCSRHFGKMLVPQGFHVTAISDAASSFASEFGSLTNTKRSATQATASRKKRLNQRASVRSHKLSTSLSAHFMQSLPSEASPKTSVSQTTPYNSNNSQHGLQDHDRAAASPGSPDTGEQEVAASTSPTATNDGVDAVHTERENGRDPGLQESRMSTPSPRPGNRILEYENESTPRLLHRSSDGPAFEVINRRGNSPMEGSPITKLPNG
jgi:hypothetical protein